MPYNIGTVLDGKVNNVKDTGIYVQIDYDTFGFMPNAKMQSHLDINGVYSGNKYDRIRVVIEDIRPDGMLLFCDLDHWTKKQVLEKFKERYEPGTIFPCEVKTVTASRAEILVCNAVEGYINKEQLGWNAINRVSDILYEGESINAVFVGEENGELLFGLKYLQEKPYDDALYGLSLNDLLGYIRHSGTMFIGECQKRGNYTFFENLYSVNPEEEGKILVDPKYGYNLRAIVPNRNAAVEEGNFYKFNLVLLPKESRLKRNQLFQFRAENIQQVSRNPYSDDMLKAFKKNISPAMIQNADDASSETGVSVSVKTEGDYLTVVHNGFSFDREDFEAITSAANGTKKANENKTGYKGIGFKSVFTDSEEVLIRTGGYQFKYQKTHPGFSNFEKFYFLTLTVKNSLSS